MRLESSAQFAAPVLDGDAGLAVLDGANPTLPQEQAPPIVLQPAQPASTTLADLARETDLLARQFDRKAAAQTTEPPIEQATPLGTAAARELVDAAPPAPPPTATAYVGEPPVDPQWLAERETALVAIRADYEAARAQALTAPGPGWIEATGTLTDESGQRRSADGRELVFVSDPNAPPVLAGYDESGNPLHQPAGRWMEFNEDAFAAHFRAQDSAPLQALATLYDTDVPGLFAQHPQIWSIATADHALNAGPAPAGHAMGDPGQLGMLDLYMADPQIAALIDAYGGQPTPASGDIALEQVRIHGQQRYEQMSRLGNAMASVRNQYTDALGQAQTSGNGPGWIERARTVTLSDESGRQTTQPLLMTDENGQPQRDSTGQPLVAMERVFDPDAFTDWYTQQGGLQHQAFKSFYGQSHTRYGTDESGQSIVTAIAFDNPKWSLAGAGGQMRHNDLQDIDPNDPPRLRNRSAVGFDLEAGWATAHDNIKHKSDWIDSVFQVAFTAVAAWFGAVTLGPAAASAMGMTTTTAAGTAALTTAGTIVSGAVAGATTSVVSGIMSDNLTLKGILQGALSGGLTAGLMDTFGAAAARQAGAAGTVALRMTVQGGIQELLGGKFRDGALAALASGVADLAGANMLKGIDNAFEAGTMNAAEAFAAKGLARMFGSALRALGSPGDPAYAFASAFVSDMVNAGLDAGAQAAREVPPAGQSEAIGLHAVAGNTFDAEGNLLPGIVDPDATPQQQRAQLQAQLEQQGFSADQADALAAQHFDRNVAVSYPVPPGGPGSEYPPSQRNWEMTRQDGEGRIVERTIWIGDGKALAYRSEIPGQCSLEVDNAHALARGADGQLQLIAANQMDSDSWTVIVPPGQTLVTNGLQSIALPGGASAQALSLAAALTAPLALPQGAALGDAAAALGRTVIGWGPTALRALGTIGLALWPSELGGGETVVALNDNARIVKPASDVVYGHLELRDEAGQWQRVQERQFNPAEAAALLAAQRTSMLTPAELQRLTGPMIHVPAPPLPPLPGYPALPDDERQPPVLPGAAVDQPPVPSVLPGAPIETPSWADSIVEQTNAQNNESLARQRQQANPDLADPASLNGTTVAGVPGATWGYPTDGTRGNSGADYQEQVSGTPAGLEANVGGQVQPNGTISGGVWVDAVQAGAGGRPVLIDAKDWVGYPPANQDFWHRGTMDEARRQLDEAVAIGGTVRWVFSDQAAADAVSRLFNSDAAKGRNLNQVQIVVIPKK